jgi:hypothetical protein
VIYVTAYLAILTIWIYAIFDRVGGIADVIGTASLVALAVLHIVVGLAVLRWQATLLPLLAIPSQSPPATRTASAVSRSRCGPISLSSPRARRSSPSSGWRPASS